MRRFAALVLAAVLASPAAAQAPVSKPLPGILAKFSSLFTSDFSGAAALAMSIPGLPDGVGARCWAHGWGPVGQVITAHPLALTGQLATDVEATRLLTIALNNLCANPDCTQVFTQQANAVATLGTGITPPSFTALCAKVPGIVSTPASAN